MSQENVELLGQLANAWNRGDSETVAKLLDAHLDPQFELDTLYPSQVYRGPTGPLDLMAEIETWDRYALKAEDIIDLGQHVLVVAGMSAPPVAGFPSSRASSSCGVLRERWRFAPRHLPLGRKPSKPPGCRSRRHTYVAATGIVYGGSARPTERGRYSWQPGLLEGFRLAWKAALLLPRERRRNNRIGK
jgi:hypothetical protein